MKKRKSPSGKEPYQTETRIARMLDVPPSVLPGVFRLEMSGNREAVVVGCEGIREYVEGGIAISAGKMMIKFTGDRLQIRSMNDGTIVVEGGIYGIAFSQAGSKTE